MKLMGPEEIANILGISRSTARRMLVDGLLPTVILRSGRRKKIYRCREDALERWILGKERERQRTKVWPISKGEEKAGK